jgi:hypothetical protein
MNAVTACHLSELFSTGFFYLSCSQRATRVAGTTNYKRKYEPDFPMGVLWMLLLAA